MGGGPGLRFALEAAFLIAVAVAAGLAELSPTTIVLVMAAAWLLVAVIEWLAWREGPRVTRIVRQDAAPPEEAVAVADEPKTGRRRFWRRGPAEEAAPTPPFATVAPGEDTEDLSPSGEQPAPVPADERSGT
jgi:hypothetical protein